MKKKILPELKLHIGADIAELEAAMARVKALLIDIENQANRTQLAVRAALSESRTQKLRPSPPHPTNYRNPGLPQVYNPKPRMGPR